MRTVWISPDDNGVENKLDFTKRILEELGIKAKVTIETGAYIKIEVNDGQPYDDGWPEC